MSISIRCHHHVHTWCPRTTHVHCSATTTTTTTTHRCNPSQNVAEPRLIKPPSLVATTSQLALDHSSLQSTWAHRAWVASGCTSVMVSLAQSVMASMDSNVWVDVESIFASILGYMLADLGSGVYHWAIDNYGDAQSPVFGTQIEAFQGHHKHPWMITRRQLANNLYALARNVTLVVIPLDVVINNGVMHAFVGACAGSIMFSQQFHAWAHGTKSRLPPLVVALQDAGLLVSRAQHATHHRPPYNNNYCIVSGVWNEFLDEHRVFEALEMVLFFRFGVRPRSWSLPNSNWIEETNSNLIA